MTTSRSEHEKTLRIVRFFLPRLSREQLAREIEDEKNQLCKQSADTVQMLRSQAETTLTAASREKEDYADRSARRISDLRRDGEDRVRQETCQLRSLLGQHEQRKGRDVMIVAAASLALVLGIVLAAATQSGIPLVLSLAGAPALLWAGADCWKVAANARTCRSEIQLREATIQNETHHKVTDEEATRSTKLVEHDGRLRQIRDRLQNDVIGEETALRDRLAALDAQLGELIRLYEESIASEEEVNEFCNSRLAELQEIVAPSLGLCVDDILDERSAEVWAPSFLQFQHLPEPVLRDAAQSEREVREWADEIIEPMRGALSRDDQWQAFRRRVLPMLGLPRPSCESVSSDSPTAPQPASLNALRAVRFSASRQAYLAGHYFYQKIVCAEDMIGLFRAYVNVLNCRIPHTFALQILYSDIAAIGIETAFNRERFDLSGMTIDQHTHSLSLELSSGTSYHMSGDAGSAAQIEPSGDSEVERVMSQANQVFRDQIVNVRALIRDAKATRPIGRIADAAT